jgi:hypothetical protein
LSLWIWLNHSAHDFRRDVAHPRACSFSIVKPGTKVITIEPSADALSVEEVVRLFSLAFERVCAFEEVQRLGTDSFAQPRPATFVEAIGPVKEALSMEGSIQNLNRELVNHLR